MNLLTCVMLNSTLSKSCYPPSKDRGFQHVLLIMATLFRMGNYYFSLALDGIPINREPLELKPFMTTLGEFYEDPSKFGNPTRVEVLRHTDMYPFLNPPIEWDFPDRDESFELISRRLPSKRRATTPYASDREEVPGVVGELAFTCESSRLSRLRPQGAMSVLYADGEQCGPGELMHFYWVLEKGQIASLFFKDGWKNDEPKPTVQALDDNAPIRLPASSVDDLVTVREWTHVQLDSDMFKVGREHA
eukprot:TRINITY_DN8312_c0_g1_i2.p1 TRINITY_DN8312_c0_g1~~TRINITY_DN8312_c0_g1_i2.p1  ORF type:complete len:247 (+),score=40.99 TRINITY_DN8312_c0_g1_i2:23-763(+)